MTFSLFILTAPVVLGTIVHWKLPRFAHILTQIGSVAGFAIIVVCQTMEVFIFPDIFTDVPVKLYVAVTLLPCLGLALGYAAATIFRLESCSRRTIAIEAGIQNVGTALAIVSLSYPFHVGHPVQRTHTLSHAQQRQTFASLSFALTLSQFCASTIMSELNFS